MLNANTKIGINALTTGMGTKNRKRLMGYGILSIIFGFIGLYMSTLMTMTTILILGIFIVESFSSPDWQGELLNLGLSVLYTAAGVVTIINPIGAAVWFTLFLAIFLAMIGILRIIMALTKSSLFVIRCK